MYKLVLAVLAALAVLAPAPAHAGIRIAPEVIIARIQRPEITYILTKQDLTPQYEFELKESFVPRMIQSVNTRGF